MVYLFFGIILETERAMRYKEKIIITNSFEETQKLGEGFVKRILLDQRVSLSKKCAFVIALHGDLGSGKTTFVQGLAKGLGIKRRVISPTFIIVRSYHFSTPPRLAGLRSKNKLLELKYFYHIDLYRIKSDKDIEGLGLEEIIKDSQNIVLIEWAEKIEKMLPKERWDVRFRYLDENKRRITIKKWT